MKKLDVDSIWFMSIHPIKGTLGSYYSVKDLYDINPEFGTRKDFQHLVDKINLMRMYVIIDWESILHGTIL